MTIQRLLAATAVVAFASSAAAETVVNTSGNVMYIPVISFLDHTLLGLGPDKKYKMVLPAEETDADCEEAVGRDPDRLEGATGYECIRIFLRDSAHICRDKNSGLLMACRF